MSNIDKQAYRADGGDIGTGRLREIADNPYGDEEKCWLAKRVLALLDELETKDKRNAELEDLLEAEIKSWMQRYGSANNRREAAEKRIAYYQDLISGLVGVSSSILREVERINNSAAAGKGDAS